MDNFIEELGQEFEGMTKAEIQAFLQFEQKYKVMHPPPERGHSELGWQFATSVTVAAAAIILAAFRTGDAFFKAAFVQGNTLFAAAEAIVAVTAIEGAVVLFAVRNAYNSQLSEDATSSELEAANVLNQVGFWIALIISMLAGLFQSVGVVEAIANSLFANVLSWSLVIFMGLGATIIAALAGHDLGVRLVIRRLADSELNLSYERSVRSYRGRLIKAWNNSSEQTSVERVKQTRYKRTESEPYNEQTHERTSERTHTKRTRMNKRVRQTQQTNRSELIKNMLFVEYNERTNIMGVTEIAELLARAETNDPNEIQQIVQRTKGYISQIRSEWIRENNLGDN